MYKKSFPNRFLQLKGWVYLLLILTLATSAFVNMPPGVSHAQGASLTVPASSSTPPGAFNKSTPTNGADKQPSNPTLKWGASSGAKSYQYCINTIGDGTCASWKSAGSNTFIKLKGLTQATTYYWQVRANNSSGTTYADGSSATSWWSFSVAPLPGNFTKVGPDSGVTDQPDNVSLSWSSSNDATDYQVCFDTSNNNSCNTPWISTNNATSFTTSFLKPGSTYYWQVRAVNGTFPTYADGKNIWRHFKVSSMPGSFNKTSPLNGVTNLPTSVTLKWGISLTAKSYQYCFDTIDNDTCDTFWSSTGTNRSIKLSGLAPGTTYYWQVRSTNSTGTTYANDSSASPWWSFSIGLPPSDFTKAGPADGTTDLSSSPELSWNASNGATSYEYCVDTSNNNTCDATWISVGANTSIKTSYLYPGKKYYWQVRAKNVVGTNYADVGTWWTFTTAYLPGSFAKSKPASGSTTSTSVTLKWGTSSHVTEYQYCLDTVNDNLCDGFWISAGTATSVVLPTLYQSTTYYWEVRAESPTGDNYADGNVWWEFTTATIPSGFHKSSPADGATDQPIDEPLSWTSSNNASDYLYCVDTIDNGICDTQWISSKDKTSVTTNNLMPDTTYYWQIYATNSYNQTYADGSASAWRSFTTGNLPGPFAKISPLNGVFGLGIPFNVNSNAISPAYSIGVTLAWTASDTATSYEYCIDRTDNNACNGSWISVGDSTSAMVTNLQPDNTYYWQVRSWNNVGPTYADGSTTSWWSFSTSPN